MNGKHIIFEKRDFYAILTINRPDKLNALNAEVLDEIGAAVAEVKKDREIRGLIITGAGEKAFVAGADISEIAELDSTTGEAFARRGSELFTEIERLPVPVVAAVNGFALGGGCELALACRIRFASENAVFGQPEALLGIMTGYGGSVRLTKLIGGARAADILLTCKRIDAATAEKIGLVNAVYKKEELLEKSVEFIRQTTECAPLSVAATLKALLDAEYESPATALEREVLRFGELCASDDSREGTRAFLEKRKADFKGK